MKVSFGAACIGCGLCVEMCPEVFEFHPDLFEARLNTSAAFEKYAPQIQRAAEVCPVENIEVEL